MEVSTLILLVLKTEIGLKGLNDTAGIFQVAAVLALSTFMEFQRMKQKLKNGISQIVAIKGRWI